MKSEERLLSTGVFSPNIIIRAFSASLTHLLPKRFGDRFSVLDRIKLMLRAFRGYYFYSAERDRELIAYCFLKRNYLRKYAFLQRNDVLINPYYVTPEFRGNGYGGKLLKTAYEDCGTDWTAIWAVVKADNLPSVATLQKMGFQQEGYSAKSGWTHRLVQSPTNLLVFRKVRQETPEGQE